MSAPSAREPSATPGSQHRVDTTDNPDSGAGDSHPADRGDRNGAGARHTPRVRDAARTRTAILAAARELFAQHGFGATTMRAVAAAAGVSPHLITRYFGGKEGLLLAATTVQLNPGGVLAGPRAGLGRRLADSIVDRWEVVDGQDPLLILLRSAGSRPEAAEALAAFLHQHSTMPIITQLRTYGLGPAEAANRAAALDAFILGVTTAHRVLAVPASTASPLAVDVRELRTWLAENLQHLIDGPHPP